MTLGLAERRVCRVLGQPRSTQRYQRESPNDEAPLTAAIIKLASQYGRYGYRQVTGLLLAGQSQAGGTHLAARRVEGAQETTASSAALADRWLVYPVASRASESCVGVDFPGFNGHL